MGWAGNVFHGAEYWLRAEEMWDQLRLLIPQERYIDVRFAALICEPEDTLRKVCTFLEVPFDSGMLDYPRDTTYEAPTPNLVGQWRRKLTPEQIRLAEARIRDKLVDRGFEPSNLEPLKVTRLMKHRLRWQDRWYRSIFRRRRFGTSMFLADMIVRWIGPRQAQSWLKNRINIIETQYLK
jgi:hypothetical protein